MEIIGCLVVIILKKNDKYVTLSPASKNKSKGYHAWHSKDMKNWIHYGPVTDFEGRWVTTVEYVNGKFYIYYDNPNDQDPHLYIDDNLYDGKLGKNIGLVFNDPTEGSDAGVIRDLDGKFHFIYEDWSPINASHRSWDSPIAGHAVSSDGITNLKILPPAIDHSTTPTGKIKTYNHPHVKRKFKYEVHSPVQDAYGDWTVIRVGDQYYLFGDYDKGKEGHKGRTPHSDVKIGRFTSNSLNKEFKLVGTLGKGHPDPTIAFAEGKFYLVTQYKDYVSSGPWVNGVKVRIGMDLDGNNKVDKWTKWQRVKESYNHTPGFARVVSKIPAEMNLSSLPQMKQLKFEFKLEKVKNVKPIIDKIIIKYK